MGSGLVHADLPAAKLLAERRAGRRPHGSYPTGGRRCGNRRCGLVDVASVHAGSTALALDGRMGHRMRHRLLDHRLLDVLAVARPRDALGLRPCHLFFHRPLYGPGAESGAEPHAFDVHRLVGPGGKRIQSHRRGAGGRNPERLVRRRARVRRRIAPLGIAAARSHGVLGDLAFFPGSQDGCPGNEARCWLRQRVSSRRHRGNEGSPADCLFGLLVVLAGAAPCARADDLEVLHHDAHFGEGPIWYHGKIFYIAPDGTLSEKAAEVHSANGIVVSNDGKTLYAIETEDHRLIQFKIGPGGSLSERRVFLDLDELTHIGGHIYPDGVKIDSKGHLYIGQNPRDVHAPLAGTIFVVDDTGKLLRTLKLPSPGVPNLALRPDEKTVNVMALDQLDKPPYHGKVYAIPNR